MVFDLPGAAISTVQQQGMLSLLLKLENRCALLHGVTISRLAAQSPLKGVPQGMLYMHASAGSVLLAVAAVPGEVVGRVPRAPASGEGGFALAAVPHR